LLVVAFLLFVPAILGVGLLFVFFVNQAGLEQLVPQVP